MKHAAPVRIEATCVGGDRPRRRSLPVPEIASLPAGMRRELEALARVTPSA